MSYMAYEGVTMMATDPYADHPLGRAWWDASVVLVGGKAWEDLSEAEHHFYAVTTEAVERVVLNALVDNKETRR